MKGLVTLFLIICVILLSGCWDQKELNDIVLVDGVGIDKAKDGKVEVTVSIVIPQSQGALGDGGAGKGAGGTHLVGVRYATGVTVAKALEQLQTKIPRKIFFGHLQAIVISEKVAKEGITDYLDLFLRHPRPSTHTYVFISKGSAKELLSLQTDLYSPVELMRGIARTETLMNKTILEVLEMLKDGDTAIPMVEKLPPEKGKKPNQTIPYLNKTAIFKGDKMVGSLDDNLTRGAMWVRNEIKEARVTIIPKNENEPITLAVLNAKTKLVPKISGDKWKITIKGKASGMIIVNYGNQNLKDKKTIDQLEKEFAKGIEKRMAETVQYVQKKKKVRLFEFGEAFERKYPKRFYAVKDRWGDIYPTVEVEYDMKVNIRADGSGTAH